MKSSFSLKFGRDKKTFQEANVALFWEIEEHIEFIEKKNFFWKEQYFLQNYFSCNFSFHFNLLEESQTFHQFIWHHFFLKSWHFKCWQSVISRLFGDQLGMTSFVIKELKIKKVMWQERQTRHRRRKRRLGLKIFGSQ